MHRVLAALVPVHGLWSLAQHQSRKSLRRFGSHPPSLGMPRGGGSGSWCTLQPGWWFPVASSVASPCVSWYSLWEVVMRWRCLGSGCQPPPSGTDSPGRQRVPAGTGGEGGCLTAHPSRWLVGHGRVTRSGGWSPQMCWGLGHFPRLELPALVLLPCQGPGEGGGLWDHPIASVPWLGRWPEGAAVCPC